MTKKEMEAMMTQLMVAFQAMQDNAPKVSAKDSKESKKALPTIEDLKADFEVFKSDSKWLVAGAKYTDGKRKGERKVFSTGRLNGLEALCEETKGATLHRPVKNKRTWIPFYVECTSKKVADEIVKKSAENTLEALKNNQAEVDALRPAGL